MSSQEQLAAWLNSALAMERSLEKVLENHAEDAKEHPEMHDRIRHHREETRTHAERVETCLKLIGAEPSALKAAAGTLFGMLQGPSTGMYRDELVKNCLADYAAEHFEIAAYRSLMVAADELNLPRVRDLCRQNLQDEMAMAQWLEQQIPVATRLQLHAAAPA